MRPTVVTALIIATALFMENMDGTVLATSLPAIAADLNEDPIVLKLALTSYMLTLAVFIPASGWVADKLGARTVFCSAIVVFTLGSLRRLPRSAGRTRPPLPSSHAIPAITVKQNCRAKLTGVTIRRSP